MKGQVQIPALEVPLDFIPTDMVASGMILALAELLEGTHAPVYQLGASDVNRCTAARLGELIGLYKRKHYQRSSKGNPFFNFVQAHIEPVFVTPERFDLASSPAFAEVGRRVA